MSDRETRLIELKERFLKAYEDELAQEQLYSTEYVQRLQKDIKKIKDEISALRNGG